MIEQLKKMIQNVDADYADIRFDKRTDEIVAYTGKELGYIGTNVQTGFVARVLKNGGYSSVKFVKPKDAEKALKDAVIQAEIMAANTKKKIEFAPAPVIKDSYKPELKTDPRSITILEKKALVEKYNAIPYKHKEIANTSMSYSDLIRERYFVNTEGSEIFEELVTSRMVGLITSKEGNLVQNVRFAGGGSDGYYNVLNLEELVEKRTKLAIDMLKAKPITGGTYNAILNPSLAGVFTHEAFGHFSEADIVEDLPSMREKMQLGTKLGTDILNIVDDPTMRNVLGFYKYDDDGVAAQKVQLMKDGVLTGRLHSRRTAAEFGDEINGHCVAEDYRFEPIIRMGTIFIEPGSDSFETLLEKLDDGLYVCDAMGGQTSGENFTFGAHYGYEVKGGKLQGMVRDINISGNLYSTLKNIKAIGNDFSLTKAGGCGKGQTNTRSCHGGPHILVNNLVIGGK